MLIKINELELISCSDGRGFYHRYMEVDVCIYEFFCQNQWKVRGIKQFKCDEIDVVSILSARLFEIGQKKKCQLLDRKINATLPMESESNLLDLACSIDLWQFPLLGSCQKVVEGKRTSVEWEEYFQHSAQDAFLSLFNHHSWGLEPEWVKCEITTEPSNKSSITCLMGYRKIPKVLWCQHNRYLDILTICHELGHVMHYHLAMFNQSFYDFEPTILVKECIAFFFEGLAMVYLCGFSSDDLIVNWRKNYQLQSERYCSNAKDTHNSDYERCYPIARLLAEHLVVGYLQNKISKEDILFMMRQGDGLSIDVLQEEMKRNGIWNE